MKGAQREAAYRAINLPPSGVTLIL